MRDVNIVIFMYILLLEFVKREIDRISECDKERERYEELMKSGFELNMVCDLKMCSV